MAYECMKAEKKVAEAQPAPRQLHGTTVVTPRVKGAGNTGK